MRTRFRPVLAVVLCLCVGSSPLQAESMQVTATTVNVRRGPTTGSAVVATAARGEVLEVLERAGEWYRVRTRAGVEGYVSAQWLKPAAATPASGASGTAGATPAPAATPAPRTPVPTSAGTGKVPHVAIAHKDVGCVLAGRFPRLEACFTPAESVGRAQVQFRADETGPWYAVDMKTDGGCASAVLPKPTTSISSFRYFIEVIDRSFTTVDNPDAAPSESFTPRVVGREIDCDQRKIVAGSQPTASVVVSLARDAGGKVLATAAQSAGTPASMAGFSTDGVTMGGATPAGGAEGAEGGKGAKAQHGMRNLAIGGAAAAAGVVVAVAAGGGGSSGSGGSGTGPGGSTPTTGTAPGASNTLTGHWVGNAGNGEGLTYVLTGEGLTCTYLFDLTTDMVQSGSTFTGTGTSVGRGVNCGIPLPSSITSVFLGQSGSGSMAGTATGGALTIQAGVLTFTGTYTSSRIDATGSTVIEGFTIQSTWRQTKQ